MDLHEYQAKEILRQEGIAVPDQAVVSSVEEAELALDEKRWERGVIKIQVHAGGRGKAGGVQFGNSRQEILEKVKQLLGMKVVNRQTGPEGKIAHQVLISPPVDIDHEYYLGATIDRKGKRAILIASPEGGMEIEEVDSDRILAVPIGIDGTIEKEDLNKVAKLMQWGDSGMKMAKGVAQVFMKTDASLLEINPLVKTTDGKLIALDAKLTIDNNALFRQIELEKCYDPTQVSPYEQEAKQHDLAYIAMEGNIGCMVNGAGLAMATMDLIQFHGGKPANFLDVGGSASAEKVAAGFRLILSDPKVKAILVNIFGGIMNCQTLAEGIVSAANEMVIEVPLIVRMEGTNVEQGKAILKQSGLAIITAEDLASAAKKAVAGVIDGNIC